MCHSFQGAWAKRRAWQAWRAAVTAAAEEAQCKLQLAAAHAFASTLRGAFVRWMVAMDLAVLQRQKLAAVLASLAAGSAGPVLRNCFGRWWAQAAWGRRTQARAQALAGARARRVLVEVFEVWAAWTRAMRADPCPGSPFASPRGQGHDEDLIWDLAQIAAGGRSSSSSEGASSDEFAVAARAAATGPTSPDEQHRQERPAGGVEPANSGGTAVTAELAAGRTNVGLAWRCRLVGRSLYGSGALGT